MKRIIKSYVLPGFVAVVGIYIGLHWAYTQTHRYDGLMQFVVLDVGQGTGIYIKTPHGRELIIDTGPSMRTIRELEKYRLFSDRFIDLVIISHADYDHMAMLPYMLRHYTIDQLWVGDQNITNGLHQASFETARDESVEVQIQKQGRVVVLDADMYLEILWPTAQSGGISRNNQSVVMHIVHGNNRFLIPGDIEHEVEEILVNQYGDRLQSEILVAAHHGSQTSTTADFVRTVDPGLVIIPVGEDNRYGHPHRNTLDTLNNLNVPVLRTDLAGSIHLISDGQTILVE